MDEGRGTPTEEPIPEMDDEERARHHEVIEANRAAEVDLRMAVRRLMFTARRLELARKRYEERIGGPHAVR